MFEQRPPLPFPFGVLLDAVIFRFPYSLLEVTNEVPQLLLLVLQRGAKLLDLDQQVTLIRAKLFAFQFET